MKMQVLKVMLSILNLVVGVVFVGTYFLSGIASLFSGEYGLAESMLGVMFGVFPTAIVCFVVYVIVKGYWYLEEAKYPKILFLFFY